MKKLLMIVSIIVAYSLSAQDVTFAKSHKSAKAKKARSGHSGSGSGHSGARNSSEHRSAKNHNVKHSRHSASYAGSHSSHFRKHFLAVNPSNFETENNTVEDPDTLGHIYYSKVLNLNVDTNADVRLYHLVQNWIGTPYLLGGDSHWGIDCSRFAGKIYNSAYRIPLGSNCREIFQQAEPLDRSELKEGDLVFFKIHSHSISHMGIYLGNNCFVHSSSSRGVMISSLEDPYYNRYFYKGGRMAYLATASNERQN